MIIINEVDELDLKQLLKLFWNKKIFIIMMVILFAIIGVVKIKYFTTPVYEATGKLISARTEKSISQGNMVSAFELTMPSSLAETYMELIKSDLIINKVIENLQLNMTTKQLKGCVTLTSLTDVYYQVSVKSTNNNLAADIANEFMKVFSEEVKNFYEIDSIHVVDAAKVPMVAQNMNLTKNVLLFAAIGGGIAVGLIMLAFALNSTVTSAEQIKKYTNLPTLASIPKYNGEEDLITLIDSKSPYAESVKILRTNLQYMYNGGDLQTVAITSSLPGEGKSWLSANLAVAFANSGKKTLIIDADMRRGRQHKLFRVRKIPGLSEFLRSTRNTTDMVAVKGKRVAKKGFAKMLVDINKYIKIDKIPHVAEMIYEDDYFMVDIEDGSRMKSLKKQAEEVEVKVEKEKKTRARRTATKTEVKEKAKGKRTATKEEAKEKIVKKATKKVEKAEEPVKKRVVKKKTAVKEVEEIPAEVIKRINRKDEMLGIEEEPVITEFIRETGIDNLYVISAGTERMESSELLSTSKLEEALEELKKEFDMIIIDTPPVSVVADGFIVSRIVDTNIIVLKHGNTEIKELNKIKNNIEEIGGEVIGTVINKIPDANKKYYNTYYNKKAN